MDTDKHDKSDFSYQALEAQVKASFPDTEPGSGCAERYALIAFLLGFAIASLSVHILPPRIAEWTAISGVAAELVGAVVLLILTLRRELPKMKDRHSIFAADLDRDFNAHRLLVAWLRSHSESALSQRLEYVRNRRERLTQRLGILIGGVERLGFLPVLIALYLQFKDAKLLWPPNVGVLPALLGLAMLVMYVVGLWGASTKLRLGLYEQLLSDAMRKSSS